MDNPTASQSHEHMNSRSDRCPMCGSEIVRGRKECESCGESVAGANERADDIFRDGNVLVIGRKSQLPDICVWSNQGAVERHQQQFHWHPRWLYALLPLLPLCVIILIFVQKKAVVEIPVGLEVLTNRRKASRLTWMVPIGGVALLVMWFMFVESVPQLNIRNFSGYVILGTFFAILTLGLVQLRYLKSVTVIKISDHYVYLKGACNDFLERFPDFPGESSRD